MVTPNAHKGSKIWNGNVARRSWIKSMNMVSHECFMIFWFHVNTRSISCFEKIEEMEIVLLVQRMSDLLSSLNEIFLTEKRLWELSFSTWRVALIVQWGILDLYKRNIMISVLKVLRYVSGTRERDYNWKLHFKKQIIEQQLQFSWTQEAVCELRNLPICSG